VSVQHPTCRRRARRSGPVVFCSQGTAHADHLHHQSAKAEIGLTIGCSSRAACAGNVAPVGSADDPEDGRGAPLRNVAPPPRRRLLFVTPIGWAHGILAGVCLIVLVESLGLPEVQTPLVLGIALGVSVQQFRALRPILGESGRRWVLVSCLGLGGPFIIADAATVAGRPLVYDLVVFVILGGVIAGALQWSLLRPVVRGANGWLIACSAGYFAAASTVWLNDRVLPNTPGVLGALQYLVVILGGGVLLGVFTAIAASRFEPRVKHHHDPAP
jgi:hypothetical protein